jgi:hypothetical protein
VDFSGAQVQTCIKMSQPELTLNQDTTSRWSSKSKAMSKIRILLPGKTFFLNEKNNELCNIMYPKKAQ